MGTEGKAEEQDGGGAGASHVRAQVMFECDGVLVEWRGVDFEKWGREIAAALPDSETWGTRTWGRVVAAATPQQLLEITTLYLIRSLTD